MPYSLMRSYTNQDLDIIGCGDFGFDKYWTNTLLSFIKIFLIIIHFEQSYIQTSKPKPHYFQCTQSQKYQIAGKVGARKSNLSGFLEEIRLYSDDFLKKGTPVFFP